MMLNVSMCTELTKFASKSDLWYAADADVQSKSRTNSRQIGVSAATAER
jgi:hypothetical protein